MNVKYANYAVDIHEVPANSGLLVFSFVPMSAANAIIDSVRIVISPATTTDVIINIGFYDDYNVYRYLFWATGSYTTAISVPFPLRISPERFLYYGIVNSSSSTVSLIAHYFYTCL